MTLEIDQSPLSGKLQNVLLTRPDGRNASLAGSLEAEGVNVIELPTNSIVMLANDDEAVLRIRAQLVGRVSPGQATAQVDPAYDFALFASVNAVLAAEKFCQQQGISWRPELVCVGMGWATNRAIRQRGWLCLEPGEKSGRESLTSEQLLQSAWTDDVRGKRVLIIKGEKGRGKMANSFRERGALVQTISLYRRDPVEYSESDLFQRLKPLLDNTSASAAVFANGDSLEVFSRLVGGDVFAELRKNLRLLVPSLRVATLARELGFEKVVVADGASDNAFLPHLLALAQ